MDDSNVWQSLIEWVQQPTNQETSPAVSTSVGSVPSSHPVGVVHSHLELRRCRDTGGGIHRGVYCHAHIQRGELLIRLPMRLAVDGTSMPETYPYHSEHDVPSDAVAVDRPVSTWLRCLAAFWATNTAHSFHAPFLASLPNEYETLWSWTADELDEYLAGTDPPTAFQDTTPTSTATTSWSMDSDAARQGYQQRVRPYLVHCGILDAAPGKSTSTLDETEFQTFAHACQVLSTRGFYMTDRHSQPDDTSSYAGPYLLPVMDLLNHAFDGASSRNGSGICTRLQVVDGCLVMVAERDIAVGDEILHSYGHELHSRQCLASYGFIPDSLVQRAASTRENQSETNDKSTIASSDEAHSSVLPVLSPVVLTKHMIWESCWSVIEARVPEQLVTSMQERDIPDEPWKIRLDRSRTADWIPTKLVLGLLTAVIATTTGAAASHSDHSTTSSHHTLLTDEVVTAACLPFLPSCAYAEIRSPPTLLDQSILQDYYLGVLVGRALLEAIQRRKALYRPISSTTRRRLGLDSNVDTDTDKNDVELLQRLLEMTRDLPVTQSSVASDPVLHQGRLRLMYGLTIRVEEKRRLNDLSEEIVAYMASLHDETGGTEHDCFDLGSPSKQQRVA